MDCKEYNELEHKAFIILTKYYLELENNYSNMCDAELGVDSNTVVQTEKTMNLANCLLNAMSKQMVI